VDHSEKVLEDWQQALEGWNITELDDPMWVVSMEGPPPPPMVSSVVETYSGGRDLPIFLLVGMIVVLVAILAGIFGFFCHALETEK